MAAITAREVSARSEREDSDLLLVDVRRTDAFEEWHIPGSVHVDVYDELKDDPEAAVESLEAIPEDEEIVTVCRAGEVSATATEILRERGYDARTLVDGLRGWSRVHRTADVPIDAGIVVQVARPGTGCLSYVLVSEGAAVVVDPSQYTEIYEAVLAEMGATLTAVLETHAHADHVSGARELAAANDVSRYLHPADAGTNVDTDALENGQQIDVGALALEVVHTPGHTAGSVTFDVNGEALLTGDTLFLDSVGRPDLEVEDERTLRDHATTLYGSLSRLLEYPDDALVLPAHDPDSPEPPTTATLDAVRERNAVLDHDRTGFVEAITAENPPTPPNHERIKRVNVGETELGPTEARRIELGPNQCAAE